MPVLLAMLRLWWLCVLLAAAAAPLAARDFRVRAGTVPELAADEGLLVVAVDSDADLRRLGFRNEQRPLVGGSLEGIDAGSTLALYVVPAGRYHWDRLEAGTRAWTMRGDPEGRFAVAPGQITYAGELVYREKLGAHFANRGLRALDWLDREHPQLARRHPFVYAGHYPDPFPAYYRAQPGGRAGADGDRHLPAPAPGPLPLPVRELWREPYLDSIALSPDGRFAAAAVHAGDRDWRLELHDLDRGGVRRIGQDAARMFGLTWVADDILAAYVATARGPRLRIFRFAGDGDAAPVVYTMPRYGALVDPLPGDADDIVFASNGSDGAVLLHRLDVRDTAALAHYRFSPRARLNRGLQDDERWFVDGAGRVRAAIVATAQVDADGGARLVRRLVYGAGDGRFAPVLDLDDPERLQPLALSADGLRIYGLSEHERAQRELVEFDPLQRRIVRTLYARPGGDVESALFDEQRQPVGVSYYEGGRLVSEYFADRGELAAALGPAFAGRTVEVLGRDRDDRRRLLSVDASDQPPRIYVSDRGDAGGPRLLGETAPWLAGTRFAPSHALALRARDGLTIEAFLTLPAGIAPRPLVVMPHGGPIGVADRRHFDPAVQFLASLGYAVLQVNFRGSGGYGRAFREAGRGGHGTAIEDDVDSAIAAALATYPLDGSRMCVVGSSYGGYSGLVSAVRWPGRFRCVVSISGVSDRLLFFTASDRGRSRAGRAELETVIGDPQRDLERLLATSPLFHVDRLDVPLMLVHGHEDDRVDFEHTRRLLRMLNLAGRPPVLLEFAGEGHGISAIENVETTWQAIAGFLRQNLDAAAPAATAAGDREGTGSESGSESGAR